MKERYRKLLNGYPEPGGVIMKKEDWIKAILALSLIGNAALFINHKLLVTHLFFQQLHGFVVLAHYITS